MPVPEVGRPDLRLPYRFMSLLFGNVCYDTFSLGIWLYSRMLGIKNISLKYAIFFFLTAPKGLELELL